jgi:hypothetical protein
VSDALLRKNFHLSKKHFSYRTLNDPYPLTLITRYSEETGCIKKIHSAQEAARINNAEILSAYA